MNSINEAGDNLTDLQRAKFDHLFHVLYDTTNDKTISRQDFFELLKKAQKLRAWRNSSPELIQANLAISRVWSGLIKGNRKYRNKASQLHISRNEWRRYWGDFVEAARRCGGWPETSLDGQVSYAWHKDYMTFMYNLMDTNGDGSLDKDEYVKCFTEFGISQEDCCLAFERFATDPKSNIILEVVEVDRFEQLWFQYLTSDNSLDPGNYIMGKYDWGGLTQY